MLPPLAPRCCCTLDDLSFGPVRAQRGCGVSPHSHSRATPLPLPLTTGTPGGKLNPGGASAVTSSGISARKLDDETGEGGFHHATVSAEMKKAIQQARLAKKWTQAQLATACAVKGELFNELTVVAPLSPPPPPLLVIILSSTRHLHSKHH